MKIVALIGSFRKGSYNRMVFNEYLKIAAAAAPEDPLEIVDGNYRDFQDDETKKFLQLHLEHFQNYLG